MAQPCFTSNDLMFGGEKTYDYFECVNCGAIFQNPMPSAEEIAHFYPDHYTVYKEETPVKSVSNFEKAVLKTRYGYDHLSVPFPYVLLARLMAGSFFRDTPAFVPNGKVLDIGCGNGEFLLKLKHLGWSCQGVEFNQKAVAVCRAAQLDVFQGELTEAAFASGSFDLITAHHFIEHVANPNKVIAEIARLLKPSGKLLLRTPNSQSLGRAWFGRYWFANDVPRHLILFSPKNMNMLASQYGLKCDFLKKIVKPKLILKSLDYKLGNTGKPSKKRKVRKYLAKLYVPVAKLSGRGDELFALYEKI
jgi:2-polyprenyl-3-methyl-5-hydroxy-6-metoxy-1,4-benzoquinol methylase